jgi:Ca-activated chloride channel homolog
VRERANDRIGLVFFGSTALTSCPLTFDHETVDQFLQRTERQQRGLWQQNSHGLLEDGTNLGLGLGTALRGLTTLGAKGRSIILVTDGKDSVGLPNWVDPLLAARHAAAKKITVHAIGVGDAKGTMTAHDPFGRVFKQRVPPNYLPDLGRLKQITNLANGEAFIASDRAGLATMFKKIDELEPSPRTVRERDDFSDRFLWPLAAGMMMLALALTLEPRLRGVA